MTSRKFWTENRPELFDKYMGGAGAAAALLREEVSASTDPLSPENAVVLAVGPLTALYPMASKTVAAFKSPLTGDYGESHAGGRSATAIRMAGYGAIVIRGASRSPVYIAIHEDKVYFRDARALWGMRSSYTVGRVIREAEPGAGVRAIMRIGRAGERLVRYATVITETYRHFGRLGLGAVFGSKKLKALVISGKKSIKVEKPQEYRRVYREIYEAAVKSKLMRKYHDIGTAVNIVPLTRIKALPSLNLKQATLQGIEEVSGEALAERHLAKRVACAHCPVACIHLAALREPYPDEPYFYKTTFVSYDYELIYSLGAMLGVTSTRGLLKLIEAVEALGLDAISTGVALAWATEALEKGVVVASETIAQLKWGDWASYLKAIEYIADQPSQFYKTLAKGVAQAAREYGGEEYALHYAGCEIPGYHTGPAAHIGYAIGARHSHLDSAGYSLDQKILAASQQPPSPQELVDKLVEEECWRQVLSSLVVCYFARGIYTPETTAKALKPLGTAVDSAALRELGQEVYKLKYRLKLELGFNPDSLKIPKRALETPTPLGKISESYFKEAITYFKHKLSKMMA